MRQLQDKAIIFILCTLNLFGHPIDIPLISALLLSVSASSFISYIDRERPMEYLCAGGLVLSLFVPDLALFLPLFFYDCFRSKKWYLRFAWVPLYLYHFHNFTVSSFFMFLFTGLLALYISRRTTEYENMMAEFHLAQDSTREESLHLEEKNRELMEKQEYEIQLATLTERNRIAREIHDLSLIHI